MYCCAWQTCNSPASTLGCCVSGNVIGLDWSKLVPRPIAAAVPLPGKNASSAATSTGPNPQKVLLQQHNKYRKVHGLANLKWDDKLAASAAKWAKTCKVERSNNAGVGENIGFGFKQYEDAVDSWYKEVRTMTSICVYPLACNAHNTLQLLVLLFAVWVHLMTAMSCLATPRLQM